MRKVAFVAEPKQRIAKNKALAKNILRTTVNGLPSVAGLEALNFNNRTNDDRSTKD